MLSNPIVTAIIGGDCRTVRSLARGRPDLLQINAPSGSSVLRLAVDKGQPDIVAALLRAGASDSDVRSEYKDLLIEYMSYISQSYFCASWMDSVEFALWMESNGTPSAMFKNCPLDAEELLDLRFLSSACEGWAVWRDGEAPRYVVLDEWLRLYSGWREPGA